MKKIGTYLLLLVLLSSFALAIYSFTVNSDRGMQCSVGGVVTAETEQFILHHFGDATSPEELMDRVVAFALEHFVYDETYLNMPQTANTHRFVFKRDFHGVCMDFSSFVKAVFQVICRFKGWNHVGCHVVLGNDMNLESGHAVNYISVRGIDGTVRVYELDTTRDVTRYRKGLSVPGAAYSVVAGSPEAVSDTILHAFTEAYKYRYNVIV